MSFCILVGGAVLGRDDQQIGAAREGVIRDGDVGGRNHDLAQVGAVGEGTGANAGGTGWHLEAFKPAPLKGIVSDDGDAPGDCGGRGVGVGVGVLGLNKEVEIKALVIKGKVVGGTSQEISGDAEADTVVSVIVQKCTSNCRTGIAGGRFGDE